MVADETEGYEADKNDIIVDFNGVAMNLTEDGTEPLTVFFGAKKKVYFTAAVDGTKQLLK
jgi:hypothetical protein